jgi:hypothetical protein
MTHLTNIDRAEWDGESFRIQGKAADQTLSLTMCADNALELALASLANSWRMSRGVG